ncbi:hypothetical protein [Bacillus cereus]|uniref:hypothetical protein n=1 Tax=Bacillus cereus TaxID=1396 RepID=UPI003819D611
MSKRTTLYHKTNENIAVVGNKIKFPKLGLVRFAKSREVEGRIVNATVLLVVHTMIGILTQVLI